MNPPLNLPTKEDPALTVPGLCQILAPYNGGREPARSTIYRAIPRGLPVAGYNRNGAPWFLASQVIPWWANASVDDR